MTFWKATIGIMSGSLIVGSWKSKEARSATSCERMNKNTASSSGVFICLISAEATTFSSGEIILHTKVSYSGLFEELWHYGEQKRNGFQELPELDIRKQEVYVKNKLITHTKAYRISEYEVNVIKESIAVYEEKIREKTR